MAAIPDDLLSITLLPDYYVPYGSSICVDSNGPNMTKPYYITSSYPEYDECCKEASPDVTMCLEATPDHLGGFDPSDIPKIPDTIIDVVMLGSVSIQLSTVPTHNSRDWSILKAVFINTITSVMLKSPIVSQVMAVKLSTFAGQSLQYRFRRRLDKTARDDNNEGALSSTRTRAKRRASQAQSLQFEMTIAARCNAFCESKIGPFGQAAFNELSEHLKYYVSSGVFSSILQEVGESSDLFNEDDAPPYTSSGALTYRSAQKSSLTLIPTWAPTTYEEDPPTRIPTKSPPGGLTESPSMEPISTGETSAPMSNGSNSDPPCESASWHPLEDFSSPT